MSDAYYEPHPRLSLARPLALIGHPGSGVAAVGRAICGRTGLPFSDVTRAAEAIAGSSRSKLVVECGLDGLRHFEGAALDKAIRRRPCGIIALESSLLEAPDDRDRLFGGCRVVHIRRPAAVLLERIRRILAEAPGSLPEFLLGAPGDPESLRDHLAPRERLLQGIDVIFEAADQPAGEVANQILGALDRLVGVERF